MKKQLRLISLFCSLFISTISAQTYRIVDVNASKFPAMEAHILVYDVNYHADSLKEVRVSVYENNQQLPILDYKPPKSSIIPTSIVLLLDISSSMEGYRFDILKKTAKEFIQNIPLEISEVALASFSDDVFLNCDFTHNIQNLYESIDNLNAVGGTDFNRAFLTPFTGAVNIARQGKLKRVIIFITDGLSDVNQSEVANKAIYDSTIINCLTIGLPISDDLKSISKETGGLYYSELNYENQIKKALEKIYSEIQINTYGKIRWRSDYSCNPVKNTLIKLGTHEIEIKFQIMDSLVGTLEIIPSSINFGAGIPNKTEYKPVFIKGNNIGLNITSINNSNDSLFGIKSIQFPIRTHANELKRLDFSFTPKDSIYALSQYTIQNPGCPDLMIGAYSGGAKKLVISSPKSGDRFARGAIVPIQWKGIEKSTSVNFFYQIKGKEYWNSMCASTQYEMKWNAPALNESIRIQGQVTNDITLSNLISNPVQITDIEDYKTSYYSPDGSEFITVSVNGIVKSWDAETGILNHTFEKNHRDDVVFFPHYNRVVSISDSTFDVFTNRNGLEMVSLALGEKKVVSSFTHQHDKELYTTVSNYFNLTQATSHLPGGKYMDGTTSANGGYAMARKNSLLTIIKLKPLKKWFSINLTENFERAILHNYKDYVAISSDSNTSVYNLSTKQLVKVFNKESFVQFASSGEHIITLGDRNIFVNDLETGVRLYSLSLNEEYTLSKSGLYLAHTVDDTLIITNLTTQNVLWKKRYEKPQKLQFFPKASRLTFLHGDSLTLLNFQPPIMEITVYKEPDLIKMVDIAPNEKSLLITSEKLVAVWNIKTQFDADTTPYFDIFIPQPNIASDIAFSKQYVGLSIEKVFPGIIKNNTKSLVIIDSIYIEYDHSNFTLVSSPGKLSLNSNEEKSVEIKFTPQTTGIITAKLVVVVGTQRYYCYLKGEGIKRSFELPSPLLQFADVKVGASTDSLIPILINTGSEVLTVKEINLQPIANDNYNLAKTVFPKFLKDGDTLWVKITFKPVQRGRQNAILNIKLDFMERLKASDIYGLGVAKREVVIAGKTIHALSSRPLESLITITELNSGMVTHQKPTNILGEFAIDLHADLNYSISAQLAGFFSSSVNIDLTMPQAVDTLFAIIELVPIIENSTVRLNNIFFESGKSDLLETSKTEILRIISLMEDQYIVKIEIHGHTDNIGNSKNNMILSRSRAMAVKEYITSKGILADRISIKSFGETQPLKNNSDEQGRKANRRVEIMFLK